MIFRLCAFLLVLWFSQSCALSATPAYAGRTDGQRLTVFEANKAKDGRAVWEYRLGQAQTVQSSGISNFTASARIKFKTEPRQLIAEHRELTYANSRDNPPPGWQVRQGVFAWRGEAGQAQPFDLPLELAGEKSLRDLSGYDALWVDYSVPPGIGLCQPDVRLEIQTRSFDRSSLATTQQWRAGVQLAGLKPLQTIDAHEAAWKAKDNFYLIGRVLHLEPDSSWRYVQEQESVVLQRRMHLSLDSAVMMDMAVEPGWVIERVNLFVRLKGDFGPGGLVEIADLPAPSLLPDGRLGVRLNLREALERRFPDAFADDLRSPGRRPIYLQEAFLYFPGEVERVAADRPLRGITLWGNDASDRMWTLPVQDEARNAYTRRMRIDLRKLSERAQATLGKAALSLNPQLDSGACAVRLDSVRLVSAYNGKAPAYVRTVEDWGRRWGGPFKLTMPEHDQVEQPGIIGYLPLESLTEPRPRRDKAVDIRFEGAKTEKGTPAAPPYRVLNASGQDIAHLKQLMGSSGVTLSATGGMVPIMGSPGAWQLNGDSAQIDLHWPVNANIGPDTWFFLGAGEGVEQIGSVEVTLQTADGQRLLRQVAPNQPVHLVQKPTHLTGMRLAITPHVLPYHFKLRELALFEPSVVNVAEALRLLLPTSLSLAPRPIPAPSEVGFLEKRPGHVAGLVGETGRVKFSTPLETPLHGVRGLSLNYRLPPSFERNGECFLLLKFKWEKGAFQRQFCPNSHADQVFVPLAAWLGEVEAGRDLGALQSIDWTVSLPGNNARGSTESFSLDFSIEGWANLSAADHLWRSPLFQAGGKPVFAEKVGIVGALGNRGASKIWLPIEDDGVARLAAAKGEIMPVKNALFELEQIAVEPVQVLVGGIWEKLVAPPVPPIPPRWPKWVLWSCFLLLAWASARKGWWSPSRAWLNVKGLAYFFYWLTSSSLCYVGRRLWFMLPWTVAWEDRLPGLARWMGWSVVMLALYGVGLFQSAQKGENYFFTFGGMAAMLALRATFLLLKPWLHRVAPVAAAHVFGGAGSLYFSGAIVGLVGTALLLSLKLEPIAEQLAVIVYYCLVVGTVLEIVALRRVQHEHPDSTPQKQP